VYIFRTCSGFIGTGLFAEAVVAVVPFVEVLLLVGCSTVVIAVFIVEVVVFLAEEEEVAVVVALLVELEVCSGCLIVWECEFDVVLMLFCRTVV
jgi:hypothetical protein